MIGIATGTTLYFSISQFLCTIEAIKHNGIKRKFSNVTTADVQDAEQFLAGVLVDNGEMELDLIYDPDQVPPIVNDPEYCILIFSQGTFWGLNLYIIEFHFNGSVEDKFSSTVKVKLSGDTVIHQLNPVPFMNDVGVNALNDDGSLTYVDQF